MSDGATEMLADERLQGEAKPATQMFRCGQVVCFIHRDAKVEDYYNMINILKTGATLCSTTNK